MSVKIALAGNPNSGKTTLFNALTGSNQYVGNWPGVTVEKKEGRLKGDRDVTITDLPGIYSLSPYTLEEVVARNYLVNESPDAILNIVDGTNIERNLYLTTQIIELGIPVVIAINMMDMVRNNGDRIDIDILSREIGCPVIEISALKNEGIEYAAEKATEAAKRGRAIAPHSFSGAVEHAIAHIEEAAVHDMPEEIQRWYAIKLFERDERVLKKLNISQELRNHIENDIKSAEREMNDDAESIITNERYEYIERIVAKCLTRKDRDKLSVSDKIDRIVTNRILALPIFVAVMWLVYTISIGTVGDWTVTFMNDGLFGSFKDTYGSGFLASLKSIPELFDIILLSADGTPTVAPWLYSLIQDGIIGGVGAVLGFVPQMLVLFLLMSLLEDCGYMSRIAFIMDRLFRKFGLSGKSFIPMLVATGCGVPGVMASRTIRNERERRATAMLAPFMPCGAKIPVIALFAGAFFDNAGWVSTVMYLSGIALIFFCALLINAITGNNKKKSFFIIELPDYKAPSIWGAFKSMCSRGWSYIVKAATIILVCNTAVQIMQTFTWSLSVAETADSSILASIAKPFAYCLVPVIGYHAWQLAAASVTGFIAKENVVATISVCYAITDVAKELPGVTPQLTSVAALAYLMFNLFSPPCFAAIGAMNAEMKSAKWLWGGIGLQLGVGFTVGYFVNTIGTLITDASMLNVPAAIGGLCAVVVFVLILVCLVANTNRKLETEIKKA